MVPHIATPLQNTVTFGVADFPHLQKLPLAHSISADKEFHISLLVGADHYWDIVGDVIEQGNGPTTEESKVGYLLSVDQLL